MEFVLGGRFPGRSAYAYTGPGGRGTAGAAAPAIVFIHGAQHDHSVWALQTRAFLEQGWRVLAPDLPGHGRTPGPALASVEAMADWLLALLDGAGVASAVLAGHSMGSLVALEAAARAGARVHGLALLGSAWPMKVSEALLTRAREDEARAIDMVNLWSHAAPLACLPLAPGVCAPAGNRRLMQRMAARNPAQLLHTDLAACNAYAGGVAAASNVTCPTLFILGRHDAMTPPRAARALADALPQAQVLQLDCGHALMTEQAGAVRDALLGFALAAGGGAGTVE
ncbi:alpha/beta fold hydrolase [Massilia sp. 9096]|uniref:alpha/beta fold hydrolase n=1 Tax=Massilia sp. 9096 TaxID=1500894 RepID=UPI000567C214|nr:alpha/beta hydrolase [Massilia sp. 9096]